MNLKNPDDNGASRAEYDGRLSGRARHFLANAEFRDSVKDETKIRAAFARKGIAPSPELIRFQKLFGGFVEYSWLTPIVFGILHSGKCEGDFAGHENELLIEEEEFPTHYICADTLYQEIFTMTENGNYYEGYNLQCRTFETLIENLSVYDELNKQGGYEKIFSYTGDTAEQCEGSAAAFSEKVSPFLKELRLSALDGCWDDILCWYKSDSGLWVKKENLNLSAFSKNKTDKDIISSFGRMLSEGA